MLLMLHRRWSLLRRFGFRSRSGKRTGSGRCTTVIKSLNKFADLTRKQLLPFEKGRHTTR